MPGQTCTTKGLTLSGKAGQTSNPGPESSLYAEKRFPGAELRLTVGP